MKIFFIPIVFALLSCVMIFGEENHYESARKQIGDIISLIRQPDPKMQWNRYETSNFEILSIDDNQGRFLYENVDNIKKWVYLRWGMRDVGLKSKLMVVPTRDLNSKLFGKNQSTWRDGNIWMITEEDRWETGILANLVSELCISKFEEVHNVKFGLWAHRGISILNGNLKLIHQKLGSCKFVYDGRSFFGMTSDGYSKLDLVGKSDFDLQAAAFCLMIRKEMGGEKAFLEFMDKERFGSESALSLLKMRNFSDFDAVLNGYMMGCSKEIQAGRMPLSYLTWKF